MKKIRVFNVLIVLLIILTGCMKTEKDENDISGNSDENGTTSKTESVCEFDMSMNHIKLDLVKNKITVDADITPYSYYCNGLGLYDVSKNENAINLDEFVHAVDEYYGYDATITQEEDAAMVQSPNDPSKANISVGNGYADFNLINTKSYSYTKAAKIYLPIYEKNFTNAFVENMHNVILEKFPFLVNDISMKYECIYFNDDVYKKADKYTKEEGYYGFINGTEGEEFYIMHYRKFLDNIPIELATIELPYKIDKNKKYNEDLLSINDDLSYNVSGEIYSDFFFDKNGKLLGINYENFYNISEKPFEVQKVIDSKEVLKKVYDRLKYSVYRIEITEIGLYYMPVTSDKTDENGYIKVYMAPFWNVKYFEEGKEYFNTLTYDAVTGKLVQNTY